MELVNYNAKTGDFIDVSGCKFEVVESYPNGVRVQNVALNVAMLNQRGFEMQYRDLLKVQARFATRGEYLAAITG